MIILITSPYSSLLTEKARDLFVEKVWKNICSYIYIVVFRGGSVGIGGCIYAHALVVIKSTKEDRINTDIVTLVPNRDLFEADQKWLSLRLCCIT